MVAIPAFSSCQRSVAAAAWLIDERIQVIPRVWDTDLSPCRVIEGWALGAARIRVLEELPRSLAEIDGDPVRPGQPATASVRPGVGAAGVGAAGRSIRVRPATIRAACGQADDQRKAG